MVIPKLEHRWYFNWQMNPIIHPHQWAISCLLYVLWRRCSVITGIILVTGSMCLFSLRLHLTFLLLHRVVTQRPWHKMPLACTLHDNRLPEQTGGRQHPFVLIVPGILLTCWLGRVLCLSWNVHMFSVRLFWYCNKFFYYFVWFIPSLYSGLLHRHGGNAMISQS